MTLNEMIRNYEATQAAMAYIIGFTLNKRVYRIVMDKLLNEMFELSRESTSHGGHAKIKLHMTNAIRVKLIEMGAEEIGGLEVLDNGRKNKGEAFEKYETERAGQVWEKDRIPYYIDGDLTVDGVKYQIKFEGASFTNEKVIAAAMEWKFGKA